jgi:hypothetical protein
MKNMVQILVQPKWWPWAQDHFIWCARRDFMQWIWAEDNRRWASGLPGMQNPKHSNPKALAWIQDRYIDGRGKFRIRLDFYQFYRAVTCDYREADVFYYIPRRGRMPKATSYVKKPEHKPKAPLANEAWRLEKQTKRDKAQVHGRRSCGARKFCSDQSARAHRAWIKQRLNSEDWDAFDQGAQDTEYAQFVEPYDWD